MRRCLRESEGIFFMGYVQGEGRTQATLFPVALEELIPDDHVCRVIDAFVDRLDMAGLGFERAEAAETGRPGYDPRDLLKLYLYGYLQQMRSSRRLEAECQRNIELLWLLGRLAPDHKSIAEVRRVPLGAGGQAGGGVVYVCPSVGLVRRGGRAGQPRHVVADGGYSNGEMAEACEAQGIILHVPANRGVNNRGDGTLFDRREFHYDAASDSFRCPAGQSLQRHQRKGLSRVYAGRPEICGACPLQSRCTVGARRLLKQHAHHAALQRMQHRATAEAMRLRRSTVEPPFATLKYRIFGHPRFLLRGLHGAQTEISLAVMVYNMKRMINIMGAGLLPLQLTTALRPPYDFQPRTLRTPQPGRQAP